MSRPLMSRTQNICLVLLCILFTLLAVIMVNEILNKKNVKESDYQIVNTDEATLLDVMEQWNVNYCKNPDILVSILFDGNFSTRDMFVGNKLLLLLPFFEEDTPIRIDELNQKLQSIMVSDLLTLDDIKEIIGNDVLTKFYTLKLEKDMLSFTKNEVVCFDNTKILTLVKKAEANDENLNVYVKFAKAEERLNDEGNIVIDYYADVNSKAFKERLVKNDEGKLNWEDYDFFRYHFKIVDGMYLLESIEKIDEEL